MVFLLKTKQKTEKKRKKFGKERKVQLSFRWFNDFRMETSNKEFNKCVQDSGEISGPEIWFWKSLAQRWQMTTIVIDGVTQRWFTNTTLAHNADMDQYLMAMKMKRGP